MDSFCFFLFVSYMCFERTFKTNDNRSFSFFRRSSNFVELVAFIFAIVIYTQLSLTKCQLNYQSRHRARGFGL